MISVYVHITGLETTLMEIDQMPGPQDTLIIGKNPRRRDGKEAPYLLPEVTTIILPMPNILFIEVMTTEQEEDIETFIRE